MYNRERRKKDPRRVMYDGAKHRAKVFGLSFTITIEDIFVPTHCPILGIPLKFGDGHNKYDSPTLDRIHPSLGYIPGNIAVISYKANRLKSDATIVELEALVRYVKSYSRVSAPKSATTVHVQLLNKEPNAQADSAGSVIG